MGMSLLRDRTQEIKRELAELRNTLKMSVTKAIRIGQLLTEQKEFVGHGLFLSWLDANFEMSERTARNYMSLFAYRDETAEIADLQTAYKQIETIEAQQKLSEEERNRAMVAEFRKTGVKPHGWTRDLDYRIKKDEEGFIKQKERIDQAKQEREQRSQEYKTKQVERENLSETLRLASDVFIKHANQRNAWKEKIRLSDGGKEDAFMDAIIDYLETLPDDNRRVEACNNIIKICRNISIELQNNNLREANNVGNHV
jgi:hypothetical protein